MKEIAAEAKEKIVSAQYQQKRQALLQKKAKKFPDSKRNFTASVTAGSTGMTLTFPG